MKRQASLIYTLLIAFLSTAPSFGQVQLNEMMPANTLSFVDQFGDYPDWLEIVNRNETTVSLNSYYLSDDLSDLQKWNLPHMDLPAGAYMVVFASGKDIREGSIHWQTLVNMGEEWQYHIPLAEAGDAWKSEKQSGASWHVGKSGIGYGDGDDSTLIESCLTLYIQKEFSINDTSAIQSLSLYMDYDDGFIAYLNGEECARSSNMGVPGSHVAFDEPANSGHEASMYKSEPIEQFILDRSALKTGSNILAIEVHNTAIGSSDLTAIPILIAGANSILDGKIPGNPYVSLADHYPHANFRIKANGEAIYLSNNKGSILDSLPMIAVPYDYSYGRVRGNPYRFGFFEDPSPGAENSKEYASTMILDSVQIVNSNMAFDTLQVIRLQTPDTNDVIYYTLDGSEPSWDDLVYRDSIVVRETTLIRARILKYHSLPGPVSTRTIFTGRTHELNIISVAMEPSDLWDEEEGIYVMGPNASSKVPYNGANFWQDWERPAHVELLSPEGDLLFEQSAGTKIFGGRSRIHPHKSQTFYARSSYGEGEFSYPFFSKKPHTSYEAFIIRNSGNDWCKSMFRDAITASMAEEMRLDHQAYEPVAQYINGEYWGLINMREKIHEHFIAAHHHVDPEEVNLIQGNMNVQAGSLDRYNELLEYLRTQDLADDNIFSGLNAYMDVDYYKRYWALNVYINNKDWPSNNSKFWSTNTPGAQWRWIEYDTDFAYGPWGSQDYKINTLLFALGEGDLHTYANKPWATEVARMLMQNTRFQKELCNTFADGLNYYFHPDRMLPVVDSFQQRILSEAPYHYSRWERSIDDWYLQVNKIREYFQKRPSFMKQHLMERFNVMGEHSILVEVNDPLAGKVRINTLTPHSYPFEGDYWHDIPIELEAVPAPGYLFSHWEGDAVTNESMISYDMLSDGYLKAVFEMAEDQDPDLVINEINYSSSPERDTRDWIEIYNNSKSPVDLNGWYLEEGFSQKQFFLPAETVMQAGSFLVVNQSRADFKRYFPENGPVSGDMEIKLGSAGDGIGIFTPDGSLHDYVVYESTLPWPEGARGTGATLELINPDLDNSLAENWKSASNMEGTPGLPNSVYADVVISIDPRLVNMVEFRVYPSPFRESTTIYFSMEKATSIMLGIYDIRGRMVDRIHEGPMQEGSHKLKWQPGPQIEAGIYIAKINSPHFSKSLRLVYVK